MKKIAIITATRAEYGILKPLIVALNNEPEFDVRLIVTGTHLLTEYGETYRLIEEDGIRIDRKVSIPIATNSGMDVSKCMAAGISAFSEYFHEEKPDLLIVLGDRYEILAFAIAAFNERIPIAHICGGETTEGAVDEAYRHAVTKMSYFHFASAEEYAKRIIQLGENPDRVFNVGGLIIENILGLSKMPMEEINDFLEFELKKPYALMTFHPVTLSDADAGQQSEEIIDAMIKCPDITFICTKANADVGGSVINQALEKASGEYDNIHLYASLGQRRYLSLMSDADFVFGNTSSGIGEAPAFKTPTVNVGDRQKGRLRADSIVDCNTKSEDIISAIRRVMKPEFAEEIKNMTNPYGDGHTSEKIVTILKEELGKDINLAKSFWDL